MDYQKLTTEDLLKKFGEGKHIPGAGSAVALQALIQANTLKTVISLTISENKRKTYGEFFPKLKQIKDDLNNRIIPLLTLLMNEDSEKFNNVIKMRTKRNNEIDLIEKASLEDSHVNEMRIAVEIPIQIAKLCIDIAKYSVYSFENAFQSVRGDTSVALIGSVSDILICISIVHLNLKSFSQNAWTDNIFFELEKLNSEYEFLSTEFNRCKNILFNEAKTKDTVQKDVLKLKAKVRELKSLSNFDIEKSAIELQRILWINKDYLWNNVEIEYPIEILKPDFALKTSLGYKFYNAENLKDYGHSSIAGLIDQNKKFVFISKSFPNEVQNFTTAHELGHAILHDDVVMHREIPLDGSTNNVNRDIKEIQADKFAAYFLMPQKQVLLYFKAYFNTSKFKINNDTSFLLINKVPSELRKECYDLRGLSRKLASASYYGMRPMNPLNEVFKVSVEAMAIRLIELELVEF